MEIQLILSILQIIFLLFGIFLLIVALFTLVFSLFYGVNILFTQGTKTWFFGSHSIVHSIAVIIAWKKLYGSFPKFWQFICILIHDIGYIGMNHLKEKTNLGHSVLGGKIAYKLFGQKGWEFVIGHSRKDAEYYNLSLSVLEPPDDYSTLIVPTWWINFTAWFENIGISGKEWQEAVRKNWERPERMGGTDLLNKLKEK